MQLFINILVGFTFSIAATCPGLSESAIAVMWGIYDKMILNVSNLTNGKLTLKQRFDSFKFLAFIGIGFVVGYFVFAKLLSFLMILYPRELSIVFIGFVLGMVPSLIKNEIISEKKFKDTKNFVYLIIGFSIIVGIVILKNIFHINTSHEHINTTGFSIVVDWKLCVTLFLVAFLSGTALALPGLSGALLMMVLGQYYNILGMVSNLHGHLIYLLPLSCFGLGVVFSFLITSRIMEKLLENNKTQVMFFIVGLIIGSIFAIWGGLPTNTISLVISIVISISMFTIVNYLVKNFSYSH